MELTFKQQEIIKDNALFLAQVFKSHADNRHSVIKSQLDLTTQDIDNIYNEFLYSGFKLYLPKKKVKRVHKHIKVVNDFGGFVDRDSMNISLPSEKQYTSELIEAINKLKAFGYTVSFNTFQGELF